MVFKITTQLCKHSLCSHLNTPVCSLISLSFGSTDFKMTQKKNSQTLNSASKGIKSLNKKPMETHFVVSEHRHQLLLYERRCVYHFILTWAFWNTTRAQTRREGTFYSSCLLFWFPYFSFQHKSFYQSPTLFAVMRKPTIWHSQPRQSKQDSSDSWRPVCKIKQKTWLNLIFHKILSFLTAVLYPILKRMYFKITMKHRWRANISKDN